MTVPYSKFIRSLILYSLLTVGSSCFSFSASPYSLKPSARRRRHFFDVTSMWGTAYSGKLNAATTTILPSDVTTPAKKQRDLHRPALNAIAEALHIRAQNLPGMPLRMDEVGSIEPWEITLTAGKIAQQSVEEWQRQEQLTLQENGEEMQVVAGRVVAVLTRLEELEEELLKRCSSSINNNNSESVTLNLGVPPEELKAFQANKDHDDAEQIRDAAAAIDAACLFDQQLRYNRAKSLLAMFLHEIEGPGLRRNNIVLPCMDIEFLSEEDYHALLVAPGEISDSSEDDVIDSVENVETIVGEEPSQSLHPVTINAIEEAFKLRAQNMTTSPLRLLDSNMEWFEVQYSIVKFADRFLEKYTRDNVHGPKWRDEELQTIGGRIVGVLTRLDDLEWEWNYRVCSSALAQPESPFVIPSDKWKSILGLHPDNVEQNCIKTLDRALLEDNNFARVRAERMLALFLLNIEGPGLKASGRAVPGGSDVNFIADDTQLSLMMPKL